MTAQRILKMGNPILRQVASNFKREEILSEDTKTLLENMWDTLELAGGIGLAAPQINKGIRLFLIDTTPFFEEENEENKSRLLTFERTWCH